MQFEERDTTQTIPDTTTEELVFAIGDVFHGTYPPEVAAWCNSNGAYLSEIEPASDGTRQFEIMAVPALTTEKKAYLVRQERDKRLAATDYLVAVDYPISAEKLELVKAYRQSLRDIPQQEGFPWSGEIDDPEIPWPVLDEAATQAER